MSRGLKQRRQRARNHAVRQAHRDAHLGALVEDDGIRCRCTLDHPRFRRIARDGTATPLRCCCCGERVEEEDHGGKSSGEGAAGKRDRHP